MQQCDKFEGVFGAIEAQSLRVCTLFYNRIQTMNLPQNTGDKKVVDTVYFFGGVGQQKSKREFLRMHKV